MSKTIAENIALTHQRIHAAVQQAERSPDAVALLAVSKKKPVSDIVLAYEAGQRAFGENYVQEGVEKIQALTHLSDLSWHFIGPLQSNKSKQVAFFFNWCHSVDSEKLATRLNNQRPADSPALNVCIQVNIDDESTKSGVPPSQVTDLAAVIDQCPQLTLRGLMAIPQAAPSPTQQAQTLSALYALYQQLKTDYPSVDTLSVGMSGDMEAAIAHGSTMVRIGTDIFGARS